MQHKMKKIDLIEKIINNRNWTRPDVNAIWIFSAVDDSNERQAAAKMYESLDLALTLAQLRADYLATV